MDHSKTNNHPKKLSLRNLLVTDEPFLLNLFISSRADLAWLEDMSEQAKESLIYQQFHCQQQQFLEHYSNAQFNILLLDNTPIGQYYVHRDILCYRLLAIVLLPEYQNLGIGSQVISDLLFEASKAGKDVRLHVAYYNYAARSLYERLGFKVTDELGVGCEMLWSYESLKNNTSH
jgi:ribosomal protein S18 acetylase RimI-like enzyme